MIALPPELPSWIYWLPIVASALTIFLALVRLPLEVRRCARMMRKFNRWIAKWATRLWSRSGAEDSESELGGRRPPLSRP